MFQKSGADIVDEEFPVGLRPFQPFTVFSACDPVKTDAMRSDEIELSAEVRQRSLRIDPADDTLDVKELGHPPEKRFVIRIEADALVAEQTAEIEKISRATPKVQNVERGRPIQPEVLDAFYVNTNPVVRVLISVDLSRVGPMRIIFAELGQFRSINRRENPLRTYRVRPAANVLPQAFRRVASKQFLKFLRNPHDKTMQ